MSQQILTIGLVINPWAGVGGAVGLKGSDGVIAEALARGAKPKANLRVRTALESLLPYSDRLHFISADGAMGSNLLAEMGFNYQKIKPLSARDISAISISDTFSKVDSIDISESSKEFAITTSAEDTRYAAQQLVDASVDILLFAGGDGTARDICAVVGEQCPVLGIPAGVKIHSSVFGITPTACGDVLEAFLRGQLVDIREAEVRDLDEEAFRNDRVKTRYFGELRVPQLGHFVQNVKQGGVEDESLVMLDIAATLQQSWQDDTLYLIGSGKTTQALMDEMMLPSTLLGVDAVFNNQLLH